jgi:light-regulated signal transduction histidine kinase (bacteriophytochrome)
MTDGQTKQDGSGAGLKHVASEALLDAATSFDAWWEQQTAGSRVWSTLERLAAREAWDAATRAALRTCKEYAHSGQNMYRRHPRHDDC